MTAPETAIEISIVIPAFNEENRLPRHLDSILEYLSPQQTSYEIIVVDDGSTDSTAEIVKRYAADDPNIHLVMLRKNSGKGYAVKTGMLKATGKLRLFTDADGATPITELDRLQMAVKKGADVAIGSRALQNDECLVQGYLHRKIMGYVFNLIVQTLTVKNISDTQCGFKLFTAEAANRIFPLQSLNGFAFDVELIFISRMKKFNVIEIPVNWTDIPKSKVKLIIDSMRMFVDIFNIRLRKLRGLYSDL